MKFDRARKKSHSQIHTEIHKLSVLEKAERIEED